MKNSSRIFWGLILVALAAYLIVSELGLITVSISAATIIMGIFCLAILFTSICKRSFGGIFFAIGLAWVSIGPAFDLPKVSIWLVLLIVIMLTGGFNLLFPSKKMKKLNNSARKNHDKWDEYADENKIGEHQKVTDTNEDNFIVCSNTFGELAKYIQSDDLKGASISNSFGELKVYFDGATIITSPIHIEVSNSFGSTQLFIPKGWNVKHDIRVFAGEAKEQNRNTVVSDGPVVNITGSVNFGEIQIIYV